MIHRFNQAIQRMICSFEREALVSSSLRRNGIDHLRRELGVGAAQA